MSGSLFPKVGLIGCGMFAGAHVRRLQAIDEIEITALCSRSLSTIDRLIERKWAHTTHFPATYTDRDRMLAEADLDAVIVLTPPAMHADDAMAALERGCHVLIEKPTVLGSEAAESLLTAADRAGRQVHGCANIPYTTVVERVRELLAEGSLGPLRMISAHFDQEWRPFAEGKWRSDPALAGGGQWIDSGAHLLATLWWSQQADLVDVAGWSRLEGLDLAVDTVLNLRLSDGVLGSLAIGGGGAATDSGCVFYCRDGRIAVDGVQGSWLKVYRGDTLIEERNEKGEPDPTSHFIACLRGEATPRIGPEEIRKETAWLERIARELKA